MTETTKVHCAGSHCRTNWSCKTGVSDEFLVKQGWKKVGKAFYCDECEPPKGKLA